MSSVGGSTTLSPETTVGSILNRWPAAMAVFQEYQAGTDGICVITREDSLKVLAERFQVSLDTVINDLRAIQHDT
jgi:hypothetical protein